MKTSGGFFKDKATVGINTITGDRVDVALIKSTSTTLEAPREKYVDYLVHVVNYGNKGKETKNGKPISQYMISDLRKRTHSHNWVVVLKSFIVLHRLAMDGTIEFNRTLSVMAVFDYMRIKNLEKTSDGARQKLFIMQYVTYLRTRVKLMDATEEGWKLEKETDDRTLRPETIEAFLNTIEQFTEIPFREETIDNFATLEAFRLLIIDGKKLYRQLSLRMLRLVNQFAEESTAAQRRYRSIYVRYQEVVNTLMNYFNTMNHSHILFKEPIPRLKPLPDSVPQMLDEIILERRRAGTPHPRQQADVPQAQPPQTSEDQRLADEEDEILQKVLRQSAEEAGVPFEGDKNNTNNTNTNTNNDNNNNNTDAAENAEAPVIKKENTMPKFTLDDLFDFTPAPPPPQQQQHFDPAFACAPPDDGWSTGVPADPPVGSSGTWGTGAPAAMEFTGQPGPGGHETPSANSFSYDNWGTGAPSTLIEEPHGDTATERQQMDPFTQAFSAPVPPPAPVIRRKTEQHSDDPFASLYMEAAGAKK